MSWDPGVRHAELTDVGLRRANNQDAHACVLAGSEEDWRRRGHLFLVADGMGAHAAGELASKLSADTISHVYSKLVVSESVPAALKMALEEANAKIHSRGMANPDFKGMGTTTTALVLTPQGAIVGHVGDSRAYRLRDSQLDQLSFDHSLVWEMHHGGMANDRAVPEFVPKNVITRSLGPHETAQVDLEGPFPLAAGDTFLLCSDGLSGQVEDPEIGAVLASLPPKEAARVLVDIANLRGGPDNTTVIVARFENPGLLGDDAIPVESESRTPPNPMRVGLWVVIGALLLTAAVLAATGWTAAALGVAIAAAIFAIVLVVSQPSSSTTEYELDDGSRLGRGPHTSIQCEPNAGTVEDFKKLAIQLRDAAREENWIVDWPRFNALESATNEALQQRKYRDAVRSVCQSISFMMQELREQRTRRGA